MFTKLGPTEILLIAGALVISFIFIVLALRVAIKSLNKKTDE